MRVSTRFVAIVVLLGIGGSLCACEQTPQGTLALHWSINGEASASACTAARVATIRVLVDHAGEEPDSDPGQPTWAYVDLPCAELTGRFTLVEGLHRVRIVALDSLGQVRSQVVEFHDVQVVDGVTTSLPRSPELEPPVDLEVPLCGDGVAQSSEWCDATDLAGQDCLTLGYDGGELGCTAQCTFDESGCTRCGDGVVDENESCDGSDLAGATCESLGRDGGELACGADCRYDPSGCTGCGNGTLEGTEACDDGNLEAGDGCSPDCRLEQGPLEALFTVRSSDASTLSDCATEAIATVAVTLRVAGVGTVVQTRETGCSAGSVTFTELGYGLYTVALSGRDAGGTEVASGISAVVDHSTPDGRSVAIDLVAYP
jgi:cysteine-rich repeat protein